MKTIEEGAIAPDFELPDQSGTPRRLSDLLQGGPVVLFFYPAAMTTGCTAESCHFRDLAAEFAAVGAQRIGISTDPVAKQAEFDKINSLGYPLLSDVDGAVATSLGVKRRFITPVKRVTLLIGTDRTVLKVIASEMSMASHADGALKFLREAPGRMA
jgi:peroxiredoxin Q/BCP